MVAESSISNKKNPIIALLYFTGASTETSNAFNGGCLGFLKSSNIVRFGTINIVSTYTTMIPPESAIPTVCIGAIGVNTREIKPITVVTADKNTAFPVEDSDARIFSDLVPSSSAYRLVMCKPYDTPKASKIGPTIITVIVTS